MERRLAETPLMSSMITINKASKNSIRALSKKLLKLLEDKTGQVYLDNVAKFGIPDEYVKKAFSEVTLLEATTSGKSTIYLALENRCKIAGFAQVNHGGDETAELDRIVVFPESTRQGIGTQFLDTIVQDERLKGTQTIIVNAGKDEMHARRFYEKNGFIRTKEATMDTPWGGRISLVTYQLKLNEP